MLTRSRGDFDEILASADLIVELIGGIEPARDYVLRAMRAGKHVVTANKLLLAAHGEELWACAREHEVQLRFEGAVAGVVPVIRVLQESLAARARRAHPRDRQRHDELHPHRDGARPARPTPTALARAQELGYAEADPTDDVTGRDAAAKMAILARLAFATPVHLDQVPYEGIEHITAEDMDYARDLGLGAEADRHGRARRRRHQRPRAPGVPLCAAIRWRRVNGSFNAVTIESDAITEITLSGPGAGGPQTASAVLGDVISAMIPPASTPETTRAAADRRRRRVRASTSRWRSTTSPACSPRSPRCWACRARRSSPSCRRGWATNARLVMVLHPLLESRFYGRCS